MVYEIKDEELVPLEKYWGTIPKIEMLDPNKVYIYHKVLILRIYFLYSFTNNYFYLL